MYLEKTGIFFPGPRPQVSNQIDAAARHLHFWSQNSRHYQFSNLDPRPPPHLSLYLSAIGKFNCLMIYSSAIGQFNCMMTISSAIGDSSISWWYRLLICGWSFQLHDDVLICHWSIELHDDIIHLGLPFAIISQFNCILICHWPVRIGRRLRGTTGDGPPNKLTCGHGPCIRLPNISRSILLLDVRQSRLHTD